MANCPCLVPPAMLCGFRLNLDCNLPPVLIVLPGYIGNGVYIIGC